MFYQDKIAVIIPAYRAEKSIEEVIRGIPEFVDWIIIVDDCSPDRVSEKVSALNHPKVTLLRHEKNTGVGGAMKTGYREAFCLEADIAVKMDSDGQMDPKYLPHLLYPLVTNEADYTKGNRFGLLSSNENMPVIRKIGSQILTFLTKLASGYWHLFDPQNGYLAVRLDVLKKIRLEWIDNTYFFENSMLVNLNIIEARASDVLMPSKYDSEESSMKISWVLQRFPWKLLKGFFHRIFYRYVYRDISPVSIMFGLGSLLMGTGGLIGCVAWFKSVFLSIPIVLGTLALGLIFIIMGFQLLLNALLLDIQQSPSGKEKVYDFSNKKVPLPIEH